MRRRNRRLGRPELAAALLGVLVLAGMLAWFVPYLTRKRESFAEVPAPPAMFAVTEFSLPSHQQACMDSVTLDSRVNLASFQLRPPQPTAAGGPPVDLVVSAAGYRGVLHVPGGYPGGGVVLPITPSPTRTVIGTACFINRGRTTVLLDGTTEPRSMSRSHTRVAGKPVVGDIALGFLSAPPRSIADRLDEVFEHASNLTDDLVPRWLVWALAILIAIGVPGAMIAAFYKALREDEAQPLRPLEPGPG